jgi:hypothetical protein
MWFLRYLTPEDPEYTIVLVRREKEKGAECEG